MGSESDVATDWKTDLIIGKNFNFENPCLLKIRTSFMDDPLLRYQKIFLMSKYGQEIDFRYLVYA